MPHFFIDPKTIDNGTAHITGTDARHISTVLRLKPGDWILLSDGKGKRWRGEIQSSSPRQVIIRTVEVENLPATPYKIRLCQALVKHDKLEWIIQKSVELGCSEIVTFTSERTVPKYRADKMERWQKIAVEAAKQCGTPFIPRLFPTIAFAKLLNDTSQTNRTSLLFFEGEEKTPFSKVGIKENAPIDLIIGPEGGFNKNEIDKTRTAGIITCGLGPLILRVETAAISAITLLQYRLGYFESNPII